MVSLSLYSLTASSQSNFVGTIWSTATLCTALSSQQLESDILPAMASIGDRDRAMSKIRIVFARFERWTKERNGPVGYTQSLVSQIKKLYVF